MLITVEQLAKVRAHLDSGLEHAEVLATFGVDERGWREEEERLLQLLATDVETGELRRLARYRDAYSAERRALLEQPSPPRSVNVEETGEVDLSILRAELPFEGRPSSPPDQATMLLPDTTPSDAPMPLPRYVEITVRLEREGDPALTLSTLGIGAWDWMRTVHDFARRFAISSALRAEFEWLMRRELGDV